MTIFGKKKLYLVKAGTSSPIHVEKYPFYIGTFSKCDIYLENNEDSYPTSISFQEENNNLFVEVPKGAGSNIIFDGITATDKYIVSNNDIHYVTINESLFYFVFSKNAKNLIEQINANSFVVYNHRDGTEFARDMAFHDIKAFLEEKFKSLDDIALFSQGSNTAVLAKKLYSNFTPSEKKLKKNFKQQKIDEDFGELICPSCWLHFSAEDINYISVHASLLGDPLLGEDEKLRFLPVKYNASGMPLDPMGVPAHEMACPHCHRKLPATFLQMKNDIISLVGAPSSGKSYYLCILLKYFPDILFKNYGIAFVDADPPLNTVVNSMKNALFQTSNAENPYLAKTQLEGGMYDRLIRHGKSVSLPKPFVYVLRDMEEFSDQTSLTFYDNAGEHFEPNVNIDDSPGSLHVASANAILFLYDPLTSTEIRQKLAHNSDPQLKKESIDQQSIILAEMSNRIKQIKNIENAHDLGIPFAFIVNKCDAIRELFDYTTLENPVSKNCFNQEIVNRNSEKIRNFLLDTVPDAVINAEMVSKNIKYFMASPFGHSPREIKKENGEKYIAPIISDIRPIFIDTPIIWALSQMGETPLFHKLNKGSKKSLFTF